MPPRHAAPSPPQLADPLYWWAKEQSRRPPDFLCEHAYRDGKLEHRGDFTREADLVRGIRVGGGNGGYETAEVCDVRRIGEGHGLRGVPGKRVDGVFPGRPQSINADQWTTAAQDEGGWRRTAEQGAEHFMAKWIVAEKARAGLRHAVVCPNVTGRIKERIAQSKRARAGSLAIVD